MEPRVQTLQHLLKTVGDLVMQPATQNVWVTAELQDVTCRGGHCYMELLQKDDQGKQLARVRGCCWANIFRPLSEKFYRATGQQFASGMQVMICVSVNMNPVFGLSLVISDINPEFTLGDLIRRRNEIIRRLTAEGIIEDNRRLHWPPAVQRIAVISSPSAAGYGDFLHQLQNNPPRLRFNIKLYPATMQGAAAPKSIISALDAILEETDRWDGVVIIRGGGATSDLQAYEDYDLAAAVAQFPLPIAIGIGHERDITVLDWVANQRCKTPTAVAEWLINRNATLLNALISAGNRIQQYAARQIAGYSEQLAQAETLLPIAARGCIERSKSTLTRGLASLYGLSASRIAPARTQLDMVSAALQTAAANRIIRENDRLDAAAGMLDVLSPAATLRRGYSITRVDGHAVTSVNQVPPGATLEITLSDGSMLAHTP